jgi:hypothetical protein
MINESSSPSDRPATEQSLREALRVLVSLVDRDVESQFEKIYGEPLDAVALRFLQDSILPISVAGSSLDQITHPNFRQVLWEHHGHDGLYGDDGEMQCNRYPPTDFKRDHVDALIAHIGQMPLSRIAGE